MIVLLPCYKDATSLCHASSCLAHWISLSEPSEGERSTDYREKLQHLHRVPKRGSSKSCPFKNFDLVNSTKPPSFSHCNYFPDGRAGDDYGLKDILEVHKGPFIGQGH